MRGGRVERLKRRNLWVIGSALIQNRDMHHVLAASICVAILLVGYNVIVEINRAMGEGALFRLFFRQLK
jgi:hypothetical protein